MSQDNTFEKLNIRVKIINFGIPIILKQRLKLELVNSLNTTQNLSRIRTGNFFELRYVYMLAFCLIRNSEFHLVLSCSLYDFLIKPCLSRDHYLHHSSSTKALNT